MKFCIIILMHSLLLLEINFSRNFVIFIQPRRRKAESKSSKSLNQFFAVEFSVVTD